MICRWKDLKHHIWFMSNHWSIQLLDITIPCLRRSEIESLMSKLAILTGENHRYTLRKLQPYKLVWPRFSKITKYTVYCIHSLYWSFNPWSSWSRHQLSTGCIIFEILIFAEVINSNEGDDWTYVRYYCSGQPCTW